MLEAIKAMLNRRMAGDAKQSFADSDYRLAAAALLLHTAAADGRIVESEHKRMRELVNEWFGLDDAACVDLMRQATLNNQSSVDFSHFINVLKRALDENERRKIVEMLRDVAYADGSYHEFEDSLIWRVANLLGVPFSGEPPKTLRRGLGEGA